jgi:hypothetical protein
MDVERCCIYFSRGGPERSISVFGRGGHVNDVDADKGSDESPSYDGEVDHNGMANEKCEKENITDDDERECDCDGGLTRIVYN